MVTVKKHRLLKALIYYRIPIYIYIAWIISMFNDILFQKVVILLDIEKKSIFYTLYNILICYGLYFVLALIFIITARSRSYKYFTGRNYWYDTRVFKRGYFSLIKFYTQKSDPHILDTSGCPYINWSDSHGIVFGSDSRGRLLYVDSDCESNFLTVGPPGSGKTRGHVMPNCKTFEGSVVCVDPKGEVGAYIKSHTDRKILVFCPDSEDALRRSVRFDILRDYHKMDSTDKKLFIENIANILIPPEGGESGSYFTTRARKIFRGICHYILDEENPRADFPYIIHSILQSNIFDWGQTIENGNCIVAKELILSLKDGNDKNMGGAYDTLTTNLLPYSNDVLDVLLSNKEPRKCVTIKQLDQGYDLYLQIKQEHLKVYAPLFSLILQEGLMRPFMQRPDASTGAKLRPILFVLDEFPRLSESISYDMIDSLLATMRSKKILLDLIVQNIGQIEKVYGHEGARAIMSNCNYQIVLATNDPDSANYFSELFGKKWVLKQSTSVTNNSASNNQSSSSGISVTEEQEDIYTPQDISDLPSTKSMIVYFQGKHVKLKKIKAT